MTRRSLDPWSPDDPAIRLMNEALNLRPTEEPARPDASAPLEPVMRRQRMRELIHRVELGDQSAVEPLRRLLDR